MKSNYIWASSSVGGRTHNSNSDGITNSTQRDFTKEIPEGNSLTTPGQVRDGLWWLNAPNHGIDVKAEFSLLLGQEDVKYEPESPFKTDASNSPRDDVPPLILNTDFSFAALVKVTNLTSM